MNFHCCFLRSRGRSIRSRSIRSTYPIPDLIDYESEGYAIRRQVDRGEGEQDSINKSKSK